MPGAIDLKNPNRPIRVGVILVNSFEALHPHSSEAKDTDWSHSKTEILDVAPIDIFSGLSTEFMHNLRKSSHGLICQHSHADPL
jgi:hypothetical protein